MPSNDPPNSIISSFGDDAGDLLGTLGVLHSLGLAKLGVGYDQLRMSPEALGKELPPGTNPILKWWLPRSLRDDPEKLSDYPADELLKAAAVLGEESGRVRIELRSMPDWQKPEWFLETIGRAERLRPGSVFLNHEREGCGLTWQWPLRVGFFDDPASVSMFEELSQEQAAAGGGWQEKIVRFDEPAAIPGECGVVVVPSLKEAGAGLNAAEGKLRCGALLCLNWDQESAGMDWIGKGREFLDRFWASGAAFVSIEESPSLPFFFEFMRALSHNHAFDRALFAACRELDLPVPVIAGSTRLMRESRLTRVLGRIRGSLNSPRMRSASVRIESGGDAEMMVGASGERASREASESMRAFEVNEGLFEHEGDFSTAMAEFGGAVEMSMESSEVDTREHPPRFLQCKVSDESGEALKDSFRPGQTHEAAVHIGIPSPDSIQPTQKIEFPTDQLPPDQKEYKLTVAFTPLTGGETSQESFAAVEKRTIVLPRGAGDSTAAIFSFEVPESAGVFEARVLVLFENRILQTARLSGAVGEPLDEDPFDRIYFEIESLVSRYFSDLENGTRFEHSLLFNQNPDETTGMTAAAGGELAISAPEGLDAEVKWFQKKFSTMAFQPKDFMGDIGSKPDVMKFLVMIARHGSNLREIVEQHIPSGSSFDSREPIQILTKALGASLPIEFAYDFEAPSPVATLCPGSQDPEFLEGKCSHPHDASVVCPAGFWGLNRVIERHKFVPDASTETFTLRNEPTAAGSALSPFTRSLLAGSQEVDAPFKPDSGMAKIFNALQGVVEGETTQVDNWKAWETHIDSSTPSLLVLVVHTEFDGDFEEQKMEVGEEQWLFYNSIGPKHVGGGSEPGPIVFLVGCKTGGAGKISYQTLASKFKAKGAAIVVSSIATINSQHAVPVLERMIQALREAVDNEVPNFGEVMRRVRCQMMSEGMLMAMCLEASGDADWVLTK